MHRFYFSDTHRENNRIQLDLDESKHAVQVLRLKKGAQIMLLNGLGGVYEAVIEDIGPKGTPIVTAGILSQLPDNEPKTRVTLYQGLPKSNKMETILQKCTELGIHSVQPVLFERSVADEGKNPEKNLQRWRKIAREAAKQCGRGQVPLVGRIKTFSEMLLRLRDHGLIVVPWEEATARHIRDVLQEIVAHEVAVLIGPEGGITPGEIEQLQQIGAHAVTLGPRILRTETAGIAALVSILTLTGDM